MARDFRRMLLDFGWMAIRFGRMKMRFGWMTIRFGRMKMRQKWRSIQPKLRAIGRVPMLTFFRLLFIGRKSMLT